MSAEERTERSEQTKWAEAALPLAASPPAAPVGELWPGAFRREEAKAVDTRRGEAGVETRPAGPDGLPADTFGVALSGGGIRSATLSLGFFQCLAAAKILPHIDYLSTVSGGGYFGSFLGRWYMRAGETRGAKPKGLLGKLKMALRLSGEEEEPVPPVRRGLADPASPPVAYLRENGRYLAPVGSGDGTLLAAVYLRNLVSIHVVLGLFALTLFLAGDLLRAEALDRWGAAGSGLRGLLLNLPGPGAWLWWSPYLWPALLVLLFLAVPIGWAYWLVPGFSDTRVRRWFPLGVTVLLVVAPWFASRVALSAGASPCRALLAEDVLKALPWLPAIAILFALLAVIPVGLAASKSERQMGTMEWTSDLRNHLSRWLRTALLASAAVLAYAVVDSLGQTFYAVASQPNGWKKAFAALLLPILAALVRYATVFLDKMPTKKRFKIPLNWIAGAVALLLAVAVLGLLSTVSHGFGWGWGTPAGQPASHLRWSAPEGGSAATVAAEGAADVVIHVRAPAVEPAAEGDGEGTMQTGCLLLLLALAAILTVLMGQAASFLNHSSYHGYYSEHLTRAWLGASNPKRWTPAGRRIAVSIPGDNIQFYEYRPHLHGGPIHVINVTFNETVSGLSQVEQRDRKGLPMALSPVGISVKRHHHALWRRHEEAGTKAGGPRQEGAPKVPPPDLIGVSPGKGYEIFPAKEPNPDYQKLTLGYWAGISGAAVSTGLGSRTSPGLSFLLGFTNVRTGYWWNSGVKPRNRADRTRRAFTEWLESGLTWLLPIQLHLINEFLGRFHGPARLRWYLTDGGHLENTGCYELLRRRIPLILCMDNGADPAFAFGDIGELVRKARIDFGAEVVFEPDGEKRRTLLRAFLDKRGLWEALLPDGGSQDDLVSAWAGASLEDLRPTVGETGDATSDDGGRAASRRRCSAFDLPCSFAHAAVAFVRYPEGPEDPEEEPRTSGSVILFVKSTVTGDEPLDVLTYKEQHPDFPHETTADQFFDEAQWESYRKLGEHMAQRLFGASPATDTHAKEEAG